MTERLLYPIPDAHQALGISRSTLYELVATGDIQMVKVGRRALIVASSLDRFVERLSTQPAH